MEKWSGQNRTSRTGSAALGSSFVSRVNSATIVWKLFPKPRKLVPQIILILPHFSNPRKFNTTKISCLTAFDNETQVKYIFKAKMFSLPSPSTLHFIFTCVEYRNYDDNRNTNYPVNTILVWPIQPDPTVKQEISVVLYFHGLLKCGKISNICGTNYHGLDDFHTNSIGIFNFCGEDTHENFYPTKKFTCLTVSSRPTKKKRSRDSSLATRDYKRMGKLINMSS